MKLFKGRSGFTLIELLVVILILAILMAIALPLYLRAVADSQRQTCRSNMQTIANAEQAYKVRSPAHVYTDDLSAASPLITGANSGDLQAVPVCPTNGTYSAAINDGTMTQTAGDGTTTITPPAGSITITCTDHGSFTPGMDAQ
jgi:type IV pilus assembly protein PilA